MTETTKPKPIENYGDRLEDFAAEAYWLTLFPERREAWVKVSGETMDEGDYPADMPVLQRAKINALRDRVDGHHIEE